MEKCAKCDREFKTTQGAAVHRARMHSKRARARKAANARWAKVRAAKKAEKAPRAIRGAMPVMIRFCPHCGHEIPNAIIS